MSTDRWFNEPSFNLNVKTTGYQYGENIEFFLTSEDLIVNSIERNESIQNLRNTIFLLSSSEVNRPIVSKKNCNVGNIIIDLIN